MWGTATSSYQVEGAFDEDGRSPSIWDTFSHLPGKTAHGHTGDIAVDQYHRYVEDVRLMAELGARAYRFSLSWPRIQPGGRGRFNQGGMDYYLRLIEELRKNSIEPVVTLYHWDLPQELQDLGGWPLRDTAYRFSDYAAHCYKHLASVVDFWITLNEPLCSSIFSYFDGNHAPALRDMQAAYSAVHHHNLAHGLAVQAFRQEGCPGEIGVTLNLSKPRPASDREEDIIAADRAADRDSRMFIGPYFGKGYPERHLSAYPGIKLPVKPGDMDIIGLPLDFLGVNYYFEHKAQFDPAAPEGYAIVGTDLEKTDMGWDIVPDGLYRLLSWVNEEYGSIPLYITENGCAVKDELTNGECLDPARIAYLKEHLAACLRAIGEGIDLRGYFLWSFIDNFEWAQGYTKRFGIVYCDYSTLKRTKKSSFEFYKNVITQNGLGRDS